MREQCLRGVGALHDPSLKPLKSEVVECPRLRKLDADLSETLPSVVWIPDANPHLRQSVSPIDAMH